jgi:long-chain acyl-CoA synthetase
MLATSHYLDNVMLHVDPFHSYCVALVLPSCQTLVVPSCQILESWSHKEGIIYKDYVCTCVKRVKQLNKFKALF